MLTFFWNGHEMFSIFKWTFKIIGPIYFIFPNKNSFLNNLFSSLCYLILFKNCINNADKSFVSILEISGLKSDGYRRSTQCTKTTSNTFMLRLRIFWKVTRDGEQLDCLMLIKSRGKQCTDRARTHS